MLATTPQYDTAVNATTRKWIPRLQIVWTDPFIDSTISADATDKNRISFPEQTADLQTTPSYKWAHLDGIIVPDGTYHPMPAITSDGQMGWWGATRCSGAAVWAPGSYPTLTVNFAERPILALTVAGDSIYNEYPVDFDIEIYDADDVLLYTENVTGNTLLSWEKSIVDENIFDATYIKLIVKKWSTANRVVKILEFYTSIIEIYEGDDIVSMNLLEEREISNGSLPVGNISANELDFELQNIKLLHDGTYIIDPFSYENSASYLENLLKKNRRVTAWIGLILPDTTTEWILLGTFWTGDWNSSEKSAVVSTSARDRMELLRKADYTASTISAYITLYDLAELVLNDALLKYPDLEWYIDPELSDYTVPVAYFIRQDYFKCIRQIVEACRGQAYMSRDDILMLTGPSFAGNI